MFKLIILTVMFVHMLHITNSARILCVFSLPSVGQKVVTRALTDELLARGHELVIITAQPNYKEENVTKVKEIDIHDKTYSIWKAEMRDYMKNAVEDPESVSMFDYAENVENLFMHQFGTAEFQKIVKEEKDTFDLLILEAPCYSSMVLTHLIKAPAVWLSASGSFFNYNAMGAPSQEILYPTQFRRKTENVSTWEKIVDVYNVKRLEYLYEHFKDNQNQWFESIIGNEVTKKDMQSKIDLLLLNEFPLWEGIRPVPQTVVHLGGMNIEPARELPQNLQLFFNTSTNDVIYVNFGTLLDTSLLPPEKVRIMVNVLSQLPYDVLWKWDGDSLPGKGPNIVTANWFPQADLLRNPKVKLFISHGGLQSTDEAIAAGVPIIGIPFLNDQFFNADNYVRHKIGLKLDIATLTEKEMTAAVTKVIENKGFEDNIFELRTFLRDKPKNSVRHAASWIEYVIRHGGAKHLESPAANMHWATYIELELLCIALLLFIITLFILLVLLRYLYGYLCYRYRQYTERRIMKGMYFPR